MGQDVGKLYQAVELWCHGVPWVRNKFVTNYMRWWPGPARAVSSETVESADSVAGRASNEASRRIHVHGL